MPRLRFSMDLGSSSRPQHTSDSVSLRRRFSILSVRVKRIATKLPKDPIQVITVPTKRISEPGVISSGRVSSQDWDYIMAITDVNSTDDLSHAIDDAQDCRSTDSLSDDEAKKNGKPGITAISGDSISAPSNNGDEDNCRIATQRLNEQWKTLRGPPEGHIHNVYCPFWRSGDTADPRPECPNNTFTVFSGNPFTSSGAAYLEQWEESRRDRSYRYGK